MNVINKEADALHTYNYEKLKHPKIVAKAFNNF
jgi:hypothetical protein